MTHALSVVATLAFVATWAGLVAQRLLLPTRGPGGPTPSPQDNGTPPGRLTLPPVEGRGDGVGRPELREVRPYDHVRDGL